MSTVGFVGFGAMGSRLAGRLLDAGNEVYGTNRTKSKARPLIEHGLHWCETPRDVAAAADVIFSMVTDDDALEAIASGPDGILADRVDARGAQLLDTPVSGSIPQAESGTLAIFVGGTDEAFATVEPLLRELGGAITHIGPNGQGLLIKLAVNISLAVQTLAFSEGLLLAERGGIDPRLAAEVMSKSSIGSPMLKARVRLLLDLPEHAWFDVTLMEKDIRLAREAAAELAVPLPSAAVADEVLNTASELSYAHRDRAGVGPGLTGPAGWAFGS